MTRLIGGASGIDVINKLRRKDVEPIGRCFRAELDVLESAESRE